MSQSTFCILKGEHGPARHGAGQGMGAEITQLCVSSYQQFGACISIHILISLQLLLPRNTSAALVD